MLDVYAKGDKDNLTKEERNELRGLVELLELEIIKHVR